MNVQVTELEGGKRQIEVEIPSEEVETAKQAAYRKYQDKAALPGFRKGKVPLDVIKARFGKAIEAEVIEELVSQTYRNAEKEQGIRPAAPAQIEEIDFSEGQPLRFKATVEVLPEIALREYKAIEVTREIRRITDQDVAQTLESLRRSHAEVISIDGEAREGHFVVADIQALDRSGIPIVGDKVENADLQLGNSPFGPEFDSALTGIKKGQEKMVQIVYPKEHPDQKLAGHERYFRVQAKEVKEMVLPELDDNLAGTVGGFQTLEELREAVRTELMRRADLSAQQSVRDHVVDRLLRDNPVSAPDGLVQRFLDSFIADVKEKSQEPFDEELLRNRYRPFAINQIKLHFILDEIKRLEGIKGEEKEVLDFVVSAARITDVEAVREEERPSFIVNP